MAKVMIMANAPWVGTGYGVAGRHTIPLIQELGHEAAYFAFFGLENGVIGYNGYRVYPAGLTTWGDDIIAHHMRGFGADTLISLLDVWVSKKFGKLAQEHGWRWFPWMPVDTDPVSQRVVDCLEGAHTVIPYSKFGEAELRRVGIENVKHIPLGMSDAFTPGDKAVARKRIGLPEDAFIVGMVAANKTYPSRKCIPEQMEAFARFHARHPNSLFYIHTLATQEYGGVDLVAIAKSLGIDEAFKFTDQYHYLMGLSEGYVADLYRSFDLLTATSVSEGFGMPILEAQACGIPVVTNACTSMTEITFSGVAITENQRFWSTLGSWVFTPDVRAICEAYEYLHERLQDEAEATRLREVAVASAQAFRWENIVKSYWSEIL